jgi:hypothetical protein
MRWWFAIRNGWQQRKQLRQFLINPQKQIHALSEITLEKLEQANIAILVLDFDGVLAGHDALEPDPDALLWLQKLSANIGEQRIALLTNKPKPERLRFFSQHFPSIHVVQQVRKKPYPDGILEIANYRGVAPHRVVLVDDRLLTGMLATCLAYSQGWYYTPPRTNYWKHPFKEMFFGMLRGLERLVF